MHRLLSAALALAGTLVASALPLAAPAQPATPAAAASPAVSPAAPAALAPPRADKRPHVVRSPHGNRVDEYYWLRDDDAEKKRDDVMEYLRAEQAYTEAMMAPIKPGVSHWPK